MQVAGVVQLSLAHAHGEAVNCLPLKPDKISEISQTTLCCIQANGFGAVFCQSHLFFHFPDRTYQSALAHGRPYSYNVVPSAWGRPLENKNQPVHSAGKVCSLHWSTGCFPAHYGDLFIRLVRSHLFRAVWSPLCRSTREVPRRGLSIQNIMLCLDNLRYVSN